MNPWHSKSLGDAIAASIDLAEIEQAFALLFEAQGRPAEMAVFTRQEPGVMHCEVTAYFSPAATKIAQAFLAQPCNSPEIGGLTLWAGSPACWQTLFQE
jgi:hypothetical protein